MSNDLIWAIVIVIVIAVIVMYCLPTEQTRESVITPANWAPIGADLVEMRGRMPLYGYKGGPIMPDRQSSSADTVETAGRMAMYGL